MGAGLAGLYTALCSSQARASVVLVSASPLAGSSSYWAQGGLAAAMSSPDSPELHLRDTVVAGRGAVRTSAARVLCDEAPAAVRALETLGVLFDCDQEGRLALGLEGGHSARRVVHAGGAATGRRLVARLSALVADDPRITVIENRRVVELLSSGDRCLGVRLDDGQALISAATVLATGGACASWARTTNPAGATGGGLLLAYAAGATLADLELVQFHPTAVVAQPDDSGAAQNGEAGCRARGKPEGIDGFLVTEAIRGEGATLLDHDGQRFVDELAPRDEVARAVQRRMALTGAASVDLDMRSVDPALFPTVVSALRRGGIDPERQLVPVAPAAHYMMGGIATDLDARSTLAGLYAVGECSCTGLHGANRLASNSLSECLVFGARAARAALAQPAASGAEPAAPADTAPSPAQPSAESREALWRHAGLERDCPGLAQLVDDPHPLVSLIARSALARAESRGAHERRDFPDSDPALDGMHVTLEAGREPRLEHWVQLPARLTST